MVPKTYSLREEHLIAMSEHFHLSFKKKFLDQAFHWHSSLELVLSPGSQNPPESSRSAPFGWVGVWSLLFTFVFS